jgi:hypothetical protein
MVEPLDKRILRMGELKVFLHQNISPNNVSLGLILQSLDTLKAQDHIVKALHAQAQGPLEETIQNKIMEVSRILCSTKKELNFSRTQ